jgi:hypothetical protein
MDGETSIMRSIAILYAVSMLAANLFAQDKPTPLDNYLETGKTIVVAKCLSVGPVNILLKANVSVQILHVVKGKETLREISIVSQFGMIPGETYLLSTENEASADKPYFTTNTRDSVIHIPRHENMELLKTLSPRIVVLRTMNTRVDTLESEMRRLTYELESLRAARKETNF